MSPVNPGKHDPVKTFDTESGANSFVKVACSAVNSVIPYDMIYKLSTRSNREVRKVQIKKK